MSPLLDTHALIWGLGDGSALSTTARIAIEAAENEILVSAASTMGVVTKHRLGTLQEAVVLAQGFEAVVRAEGFKPHVHLAPPCRAGRRSPDRPPKDPFDRMPIAQALVEGIPLVSNERLFDAFGIRCVW